MIPAVAMLLQSGVSLDTQARKIIIEWNVEAQTSQLLKLKTGEKSDGPTHKERLFFQDLRGCTALHFAANKSTDNADESKDLEQMLIKKGANLFLKDNFGRLPLHYLFTKLPRDR